MKIIVGLGNLGVRYEMTRHNAGFLVIDALANAEKILIREKKFGGLLGTGVLEGHEVALFKPQSFMNLSGKPVMELLHALAVDISHDLLIVYDDVALDFGTLRFRHRGTSGGHNGLGGIIEALGTEEITRLRVGIDGPRNGVDLATYVLSPFSEVETKELDGVVQRAMEACRHWLRDGIQFAMNKYN